MRTHRLTDAVIREEAQLRALIGTPSELVCRKVSERLNDLTRRFIELAPFVCVASCDSRGRCDVSPRGDPAGFVRILDERTLLLPERPGNRIADTLVNLLDDPRIALLFLIPGVTESFRVNGRATLTHDAALLASSALEGKAPKLGILVDIDEAYTQCSKASLRAGLWDPSRFRTPTDVPTSGAIFRELLGADFDAATYDSERAKRYERREGFY